LLRKKKSFETFFAAFVLAQCRHYEAKSVLDSVGYLLGNGTDVIILENIFAKKMAKNWRFFVQNAASFC
jgi:hypothetical protein